MNLKRIDQIVFELYPQWTRTQVQKLIQSGNIEISIEGSPWKVIDRPGVKFPPEKVLKDNVRIADLRHLKYVSQGALKLEKALDYFSIEVKNAMVLDMGLSTGGFSDVLLQRGVQRILGLDVGKGQLHPRLKVEPRLMAYDKINGRHPIPLNILKDFFKEKPPYFDIIVVDVSFISLELIIPNLVSYLKTKGQIVTLVKPQFESTKKDLNKKGVVKSEELRRQALEKIIGVFSQNALEHMLYCDSPIEGDNGNKEYLLTGRKA